MQRKRPQKLSNGEIVKTVLKVVGVAGFISVALIAPNSIQMLEALGFIEGPRTRHRRYQIENIFERLQQQGLVKITTSPNRTQKTTLTKAGRELLRKYTLQEMTIPRQRHWDRKWRLVIFDVWESRRHVRDELRAILKDLGFIHLQHSVWIIPYPCEEIVQLIKLTFHLGRGCLYLTADSFQGDTFLRNKFGLF